MTGFKTKRTPTGVKVKLTGDMFTRDQVEQLIAQINDLGIPAAVEAPTDPKTVELQVEESLRLFGTAYEVDGKFVHPCRVRAHRKGEPIEMQWCEDCGTINECGQAGRCLGAEQKTIRIPLEVDATQFNAFCDKAFLRLAQLVTLGREAGVKFVDGSDRMAGLYFIGGDNSGHEYLVPLNHQEEWREWSELPEDDERGWSEPDYARRIDGGTLVFEDPRILTSVNELVDPFAS